MILKIVFFASIFFTAFYLIHSGFKYTRMISNIFLSLVYKPVSESFSQTRGEKVYILDSSDREIETVFVEKKTARKLIIFCHESGAPKESWEKYAYFLPDLGFHVLSVDLSSKTSETHENSLSQWPTEEDVEKVLTVVRWSKNVLNLEEGVALFGVSNGADIALAASFVDPSIKAVIADGLFSMKEIFRDYIRRWAPILVKPNLFGQNYPGFVVNVFTNLGFWYCQKRSKKSFIDVEKLLKKKHVPLLMIHGEDDDYVPETHQQFLQNMNKNHKNEEYLVVPKAPHNQAVVVGREAYEKKITDFLNRIYF